MTTRGGVGRYIHLFIEELSQLRCIMMTADDFDYEASRINADRYDIVAFDLQNENHYIQAARMINQEEEDSPPSFALVGGS